MDDNTKKWSNEDVITWLNNIVNLPQYSKIFENNYINGKSLLSLNDNTLKNEFGILAYGHRYEIMEQIDILKSKLKNETKYI